jgi:hypothetical protein
MSGFCGFSCVRTPEFLRRFRCCRLYAFTCFRAFVGAARFGASGMAAIFGTTLGMAVRSSAPTAPTRAHDFSRQLSAEQSATF